MFKHKFSLLWIVLLVAVFAATSLTGCSKVSEKAGEKAAEKAIESATGGQAKVDLKNNEVKIETPEGTATMQTGDNLKWPASLPSDVPELKDGKIAMVNELTNKGGKGATVYFEDIKDKNAGTNYKQSLEGKGWTMSMVTTTTDGMMLAAEKGDWTLQATFSQDNKATIWAFPKDK